MTELVLVSASDEPALLEQVRRLVAFLERVPDVRFLDVAYTCACTRGPCTLAIIAEDVAGLRARLSSALSRLESPTCRRIRDKSGTYYFRDRLLGEGRGKLAFVYPGVMSFYPDMMRDLAIEYPECRSAFDELEEALSGNRDFTPSSFVFPPADYYRQDADIFKSGAYAQALVATYAGCVALSRLLASCGVEPHGIVGFAGGDLAAMMRSGAAGEPPNRSDRISITRDIYGIVDKAVNHGGLPQVAMISLVLRRPEESETLFSLLPADKVMPVVDFSPRQKTYAVAPDFVEVVLGTCAQAGVRTVRLALDRPFNTRLSKSLVPVISKFAARWMKHSPVCDIYSCATADRLPSGLRPARRDTGERWALPVRFTETVRKMHADGYRVFLEVGPRGLLSAAVEDTLRGEEHAAVALDSIHRRSRLQIQHAIGQLAALGAQPDIAAPLVRRGAKKLDFDAVLSLEVRTTAEMKLSHAFPRLTLLSGETFIHGTSFLAEARGRGAKAAARAAVIAQNARRQRQFDFGAMNPLVSDADTLSASPGVSVEISKTFKVSELPFIGDYALGTSQLSYSDPNLKGLILLSLSLGAEIMGEVAGLVVPNRNILRIEDLNCRRSVSFDKGELKLFVLAERVASASPNESAVKVQLRDDSPNSAYTWPVMEATFVLSDSVPAPRTAEFEPHSKPRSVHWSGRDIYPARLCYGSRIRGISFVEAWSEKGLDYEVVVPPLAGNVVFTQFPMWAVNPVLLESVVSGFPLWRSHERFTGAFSFPFRFRRIEFHGFVPSEGSKLNCYLRLTGVTPRSHLCDITVTDGNGKGLISVSGWEELTEHVPTAYREMVMQPALTFLTKPLESETLGNPTTDAASAFVTDVPYAIFQRNEELWLKMFSRIVLSADEQRDFLGMTGSVSRRTEWLFGRIAAKESVRRFLKDYYQARWSDADIQIWADDSGKPHALGDWREFLTTRLDIAIAHTAQFVVAVAAANVRVGVDVESVGRDLSKEFAEGVFTEDEREIAAQATNPSLALIRFWCSKEAVSKALGTGIRYSPRELVITGYRADAGTVVLRLLGAWEEAFKRFTGRDLSVAVRTVRDHVLAVCFIPDSLFRDED